MRRNVALAILLAFSLMINVLLLLRESDADFSEKNTPPEMSSVGVDSQGMRARPHVKPPTAECEQRLRRCSKALLAGPDVDPPSSSPLRSSERFQSASPNQSLTARFAPWIDKVFQNSTVDHDLECRDGSCKLTQVIKLHDNPQKTVDKLNTIAKRLQTEGRTKDVCGWEFLATRPSKDLTSGEATLVDEAYFRPCDRSVPSAKEIIRDVLRRFEQSDIAERCRSEYAERGALDVRIDGESAQALAFYFGGTLAYTPAGDCLEQGLRGLGSAVQVLQGAEPAVVFHRVEL